jgi:hypothetical protein
VAKFVSTSPRERSGSRTQKRYDYQLCWAFCLLLDLHKASKDYLLVLDYHDDVVVFDSETTPTGIDFYQLKAKSRGTWTLKNLLKAEKGQQLSILGKLYAHRLEFGDFAKSGNIISNASFSVKHKDSPTKRKILEYCTTADLCWDALKEVSVALQREHDLSYCPLCDIDTVFRADNLSITEPRTHARGRFMEFIDAQKNTTHCPVSHAFNAIVSELQKRSSFDKQLSSVTDLLSKKGIGRTEFGELVARAQSAAEPARWNTIESQLTRDGADLFTVQRYRRAWETYEIQRLDPANAVLKKAQKLISKEIDSMLRQRRLSPLPAFVSDCVDQCFARMAKANLPLSNSNIQGIILSLLSEK